MKRVLILSNEESAESPGLITDALRYGLPQGLCNIPNLQSVVRSLGAYEVVVLYHKQIGEVGRLAPDAVLLSGIFTDRALPYDTVLREYEGVISWLRTADVPTFGICLGLQLICSAAFWRASRAGKWALGIGMGAAFGVGIRRLPGEGEFGFKPLYRQTAHPLLEGVAEPLHCLELHRCEIDHVPEGFSLLLSSDLCRGQMIAHASRSLFGTQFHPELTDGYHRDGIQLLENFLRLY